MNEKSWKPIIIKGWGGTVPRPYIPVAIDGVGAIIGGTHGYIPVWPPGE